VHAGNGQEGWDQLVQNPDVNLVLVDINMPVMSGLDFIKKVKGARSYDHIPIVIVSTEGKEEDTERGLALGARGYVKKPFEPSSLHALIEKLCPASG